MIVGAGASASASASTPSSYVIVFTDYGYAKIDSEDSQKLIDEEQKLRQEIQQAIYEDRKLSSELSTSGIGDLESDK